VTAQPCVLLKYGELMLKGQNRPKFESALLRSVNARLETHPGRVRVRGRPGLIVLYPDTSAEEVAERVRDVIGVSVVQPALRVGATPEAAAEGALLALRRAFGDRRRTFAVRTRRRNKRFPLTSMQLSEYVGRRVREDLGWRVDLDSPEVTVWLEVDANEVFVSLQKQRGQGGLPVGSSGRAMVLLSGGFDSPVAAYRAMRRGLRCEFVHFTGAPYTVPASTYKAYALARELSRFQGTGTLHVIPIGRLQKDLATAGVGSLQTVAHRRLMIRIAEELARSVGAECLVTGDSLGQVSSQTLSNLATTEQATTLPLLRPLLAWDKQEIIDEARRIGTAEISRLPDQDCCTLFSPSVAATHSNPQHLTALEERSGVEGLVRVALTHRQAMAVVPGERPDGAIPQQPVPQVS
jgi:tRNA uracil 4-sulfurtransferase